jgi:large conductance mechanosensitive channel
MLDLAVGIIIGAAFGNVVNSLVKDVFMAAVGGLLKFDFKSWVLPLWFSGKGLNVKEMQERGIPYMDFGSFITVTINFLVIALILFLVVKAFNRAKRVFEEEKATTPAEAPADVKLLTEIRDLLAGPPTGKSERHM